MSNSEQLIRAVQSAARRLTSSGSFEALLAEVLAISVQAVGAEGGTIYHHEPSTKRLRFQHVIPLEVVDKLPFTDIPDDYGIAGLAFHQRRTIISHPQKSEDERHPDIERATGISIRNMLTVPLMMESEEPVGILQIINKKKGDFTEADVAMMDTLAAISTMAYHNSKLKDQESRASSLLGMGKVGHDIGNLAASLHASMSYSELALSGLTNELQTGEHSETIKMYVESLSSMHKDLKASIDRIVGYSRLISDLSAGKKLRPNFKLASMSETILTSATYLENEGHANHVAIRYDVQKDAPRLLHDELYIFRIVQNLVGNAIKAVRETIPEEWLKTISPKDRDVVFGEVLVRYWHDKAGHHLAVSDTGPGMDENTVNSILAGTARSQWDRASGSGWGMKIVLELASIHLAQFSITSQPGQGTTFLLTFPDRTSEV